MAVVTVPRPRLLWRIRRDVRGYPVGSLVVVTLFVVIGIVGPWLPVHNPAALDIGRVFLPPLAHPDHWLGTDQLGRDIAARLLFGTRASLLVAIGGVAVTAAIGTTLGIIAGYFRGLADTIIMRGVDAVLSLPGILAVLPIIAAFGPSLQNLILVLAIIGWAGYARVIRGEVLSLRERDFVRLAVIAGCSRPRILLVHILPNVLNTLIVLVSLSFGGIIIFESGVSFLGLGVQPPDVSWGLMLAESRSYLTTAWWLMSPGLAITVTVLALNMLGDWLRVRLDPKQGGHDR